MNGLEFVFQGLLRYQGTGIPPTSVGLTLFSLVDGASTREREDSKISFLLQILIISSFSILIISLYGRKENSKDNHLSADMAILQLPLALIFLFSEAGNITELPTKLLYSEIWTPQIRKSDSVKKLELFDMSDSDLSLTIKLLFPINILINI